MCFKEFSWQFRDQLTYIFEYCAAIKKNQTQILIQTICNLFLRKFQNSRETNCKSLVQIRGGPDLDPPPSDISTLPPDLDSVMFRILDNHIYQILPTTEKT